MPASVVSYAKVWSHMHISLLYRISLLIIVIKGIYHIMCIHTFHVHLCTMPHVCIHKFYIERLDTAHAAVRLASNVRIMYQCHLLSHNAHLYSSYT